MNKRILVLGKGFIGLRIVESLNCNFSEKKIYSFNDAENVIEKYKPRILINCIGHTGKNNVDECELKKDKTIFSNTFIPILLAEICLRKKIKLVHISSGCIYHYDYRHGSPISEKQIPDYFDLFYSRSKIYSERALDALSKKHDVLIVRIRVPLDNRPHPRNILTKLIGYKKAIDIPNSIIYVPDFLKALKYLIKIDAKGIYNVVNKGNLRYPKLLNVYKKHVPDFHFDIIDYNKLKLTRTNLILSVGKLEKTGFKMRNINSILDTCVKNYLKYNY